MFPKWYEAPGSTDSGGTAPKPTASLGIAEFATQNLVFDVHGGGHLVYLGHVVVDMRGKNPMELASPQPNLEDEFNRVDRHPQATVEDHFDQAVLEYQRRYGSAAAALTPEADVAHRPFVYAGGTAPTAIGGFELGQDLRQAEAVCTGAHLAWDKLPDHGFSCGGTPVATFTPATVRITACADTVCAIAVDASDSTWSTLVERFGSAISALEHGRDPRPERHSDSLPDCNDGLKSCFAAGRARTSATWHWPGRRMVSVVLDGGPRDGAPSLVLTYAAGAPNVR